MRYLSVCSGVEAASVAWHDLGWTPVAFSEIEPFPSAVLKHRFPDVPNLGDMTKYKEWPIEPGTVDVLVGGTPCQSFSVAGLRKGLDDPRGNLMLVYLGLAEHFRIPWLVWENVPGVLSSNGGRDFGTFLGALGQLGYRWSYRVLDAQYFGVPQRRRRVFVVASLGDRPHPTKVLFEPESLRGHSAPRRKAREGVARGARPGAESGGRPGPFWNGADVAEALTRTSDDQRMPDKGRMQMVVQPYRMTAFGQYADDDSDSTCKQRDHKDATDLVVTATGPVTHTLKADEFDGSEDGTGRGTPIVPVAFHPTQDPISSTGATHALGTGSKGGCATVAVAMINMQGSKGNSVAQADGPSYTLNAMHGHDVHAVAVAIPIISDADRAESSAQTPSPDAEGRVRLRDPGLGIGNEGDPMFTLQATKPHAIAFAQNTRDEVRLIGGDGQTVGALAAQPGMKQTTYLATTIPILEAGKRVGVSQTDPRAGIGIGQEGDPMYTLQASAQHAVATVTGTLSSHGSAAGGLGTDFEVAGGLQAAYREDLQACTEADTLALEDLSHADAAQANARKVLRTVLDEIGAEAFTEWGLGVAASLQSQEVLQHHLHGEGVRSEAATQSVLGGVSLPRKEDDSAGSVRGLWEVGCARRSPCGWGSHEQRYQELAAYLSELSHPSASWRQVVQSVRATLETVRVLHDARSPIQEVGRSVHGERQSVRASSEGHGSESDTVVRGLGLLDAVSREWLLRDARTAGETRKAVMSCRRLMPIETEFLQGFPADWTLIPWKGKPASECPDGPRYKAMGNSMAVPVMRWIGTRLDALVKGTL